MALSAAAAKSRIEELFAAWKVLAATQEQFHAARERMLAPGSNFIPDLSSILPDLSSLFPFVQSLIRHEFGDEQPFRTHASCVPSFGSRLFIR